MRTLLLVLTCALCGCSATPTSCAQLQCDLGQTCAFVTQYPSCLTPCPTTDAGCPGGASCTCAGSCSGCDNCIMVCPNVTR